MHWNTSGHHTDSDQLSEQEKELKIHGANQEQTPLLSPYSVLKK